MWATRTILIITTQLFFGTCFAVDACSITYGNDRRCVDEGDIVDAGSLRIKLKEHIHAKYPSDRVPGKEDYEIERRWMYLVDIKAPGVIKRDIKLWEKIPVVLEICGKEVTITYPRTCTISVSEF
jgi:hypothetical protein